MNNSLSTTEKAQVIINVKSRGFLMAYLGVTFPTLRHRLAGVYDWKFAERAVIDDLYDRISEILELERKADKLLEEYRTRLDELDA